MTSRLRALVHTLSLATLLALTGCGSDHSSDPDAPEPPRTSEGDVAGNRLQGELEVLVVDYDDGSSETQYLLRVSDDQSVPLELDVDELPTLVTGDHVVVYGTQQGDTFIVDSLELANTDDDGTSSLSQALTGNGIRTRSRAVALLVHWGNPDSMTVNTMRSRLFTASNSTAQFHKEGSYNLVDLTGDVFGWFQIQAPSGCDYSTIASRARSAAQAAGINLSSYNQILYYFPRTSACGWSGLASVGRPTAPARDSWYNGSAGCVVLAHELQHNFGSRHSRSYQCSGGRSIAAPSSCTYSEYGDRFDAMGGGCYHTNNYQKSGQGWFGGCNVVTANGSGTFDIVPTQVASNDVQTLRIPMASSLCPEGMSTCYYTIEYRQPVGAIEGGNSSSQSVYRGVLVHAMPPADFSGNSRLSNPYLLDMNPATSTFNDAPLLVGQSFQDPNGVRISVISADRERARVSVERPGGSSGGAVCIDGSPYSGGGSSPPSDTTPPTVTQVSPANGATAAPGTVQLVGTISDNVGIASAELIWTNGGNTWTVECASAQSPFACTQSGSTYTFSVQVGVEGTRTWRLRGTDTSGNVTTSAVRTLEIVNSPPPSNDPPVVSHVSPSHGATLPANSTITVIADVTSGAGVSSAELLWWNNGSTTVIDCATASGAASCSQSGNRYTWSLRVGGGANRWWRVRGTDTAGRLTTSEWSLINLQ